ncbi:nuclear receptor 2C2-associated protein [Octopus bimaculoides]|uniref:F5/8 type C domain-containing protein n=1 Tax=Octopus bimaculoides TaxID=37653 RepID=A0A0L8FUZ5_OCTBM|nr:nuclear receptor 2C2-associated protein [Octopus bimaculoides]|eukprot:XP_014786845.1 PREDICTED: nuclear receptor 2C2-associated protein-like [Octopus bimaculoides]
MCSLIQDKTRVRVSSVLNRDVKQFGKSGLFDCRDDTCWNSSEGTPQWILVDLGIQAEIKEIAISFQGGFAGKDCWIETSSSVNSNELKYLCKFYPEDNSTLQIFPLKESPTAQLIKIVFHTSTDFYGRIIVYKLDIIGVDLTEK